MGKIYSSYQMNSDISIEIDNNKDDMHGEGGMHCHVKKTHRGRVAQIYLNPFCRYARQPDSDDLSFKEQNKVLKYCESIREQLIRDCENVLKKSK